VGKLRTVLPLKNRVIRDSAVQLGLTHAATLGVSAGASRCSSGAPWFSASVHQNIVPPSGNPTSYMCRSCRHHPPPRLAWSGSNNSAKG
jgi:hypothetical protein